MPLLISLPRPIFATLIFSIILKTNFVFANDQKGPTTEAQKPSLINSSLILDWIAIPKKEKDSIWVEHIYTINEGLQSRQKEDRIAKELHGPDFENWTKLNEPKSVLLIAENGKTVITLAKEYMFIKGCGENEKLKLDFSNLPGLQGEKWVLAVVANETLKYNMKKLAASNDSFKVAITGAPNADQLTADIGRKTKVVNILREQKIYLDTDCN